MFAGMIVPKKIEHNQLNVVVEAIIQSTDIRVYLS
jgi:hypothetical protein